MTTESDLPASSQHYYAPLRAAAREDVPAVADTDTLPAAADDDEKEDVKA